MSASPCPHCEHLVADTAKTCPSCAGQVQERDHSTLVFFGILFVISIVLGTLIEAGKAIFT